MIDEEKIRELVEETSVRSMRYIFAILTIFAVTIITVMLGSIFLVETAEQSESFMYYGSFIGFGLLILLYVINWVYCYRFVKRVKALHIEELKLRRLLWLTKLSSIFYMIPITFPLAMISFYKVKVYSKGIYRKGTLDEILYKYILLEKEIGIFDKVLSKMNIQIDKKKYVAKASLLAKIGGFILLIISFIFCIKSMIFPMEMTLGNETIKATIWELFTYPAEIGFWLGVIIMLFIIGTIGLIISKKVRNKVTTSQGVILIIFGVPVITVLGIGFLYVIAGIQILLVTNSKG